MGNACGGARISHRPSIDVLGAMRATPFFVYLSEEELRSLARCCTVVCLKDQQELHAGEDEVFVVAEGELILSTVLPTQSLRDKATNKSLEETLFLCKKRVGDVCNRGAADGTAQDQVATVYQKATKWVDSLTITANGDTVLLKLDGDARRRAFLKANPESAKVLSMVQNQRIATFLRGLPFMADVRDGQVNLLAGMCRYEALPPGRVIVSEGESGDKLYIIIAGSCRVCAAGEGKGERGGEGASGTPTASPDAPPGRSRSFFARKAPRPAPPAPPAGGGATVALLGQGQHFGETALLLDIPRTSTVKSAEKVLLVSVQKADFRNFLKVAPAAQARMQLLMQERIVQLLSQMDAGIFHGMDAERLVHLAAACEVQERAEGDVIFREGDIGDGMYVIIHGAVGIYAGDGAVELGRVVGGAYFGEMALVSHQARQATCKALSPCILLKVTQENFRRFFCDVPDKIAEFTIRLLTCDAELVHFLHHARGRAAFHQYLKSEYATENFAFWDSVEAFKGRFPELDEAGRRAAAERVLEAHIGAAAELEVNISSSLKEEIHRAMERDAVPASIFESAQAAVYTLLVRDNFARWKASPLFGEFLASIGMFVGDFIADEDTSRAEKREIDRSRKASMHTGGTFALRGAEPGRPPP